MAMIWRGENAAHTTKTQLEGCARDWKHYLGNGLLYIGVKLEEYDEFILKDIPQKTENKHIFD